MSPKTTTCSAAKENDTLAAKKTTYFTAKVIDMLLSLCERHAPSPKNAVLSRKTKYYDAEQKDTLCH